MFVPFVALRYLFSKKKHNTINLITWVSMVGVAIGSMALVCVLSVMNGFERVVQESFSAFDPEIKILPASGSFFRTDDNRVRDALATVERGVWCEVLELDGLLGYADRQSPAKIKGVCDEFSYIAGFDSMLWSGVLNLEYGYGGEGYGCLGIGLAQKLGCGVDYDNPVTLFAPKNKKINLARPDANFTKVSFYCSGVFAVQQQKYDDAYTIMPIDVVRRAYGMDSCCVSAIEVRISGLTSAVPDRSISAVQKKMRQTLGDGFLVLNRHEQQADFYKISKIEKWTTFMILCFIILIAMFNIVGSLTMIMIDKEDDVVLFRSLGATHRQIVRLFVTEGLLISTLGCAFGVIVGIALVKTQEIFGFLKLGTGFITQIYPVELRLFDVVCVLFAVVAMGFLTSLYATNSQISKNREMEKSDE